jgi:uracil-DNA glycosylase
LAKIKLTLVVGQYAKAWHLPQSAALNITDTVMAWRDYGPSIMPLPHPSPRNNIWLKRNPWFGEEIIPALQKRVRGILKTL